MNLYDLIKSRTHATSMIAIVVVWFSGCAFVPDNFQFSKEVVNREALSQVKRVALLDVPTPTGIWLGDPGSGGALFFLGPLGALGTATHSGGEVTSSTLFSETTQKEMQYWLGQAGIEVVLLKAERVKKSKMLKNYDQFKEVDADAILEIAPIRVGFMEKPFSMSGQLSPDVALTYRMITPDNQVLIESNVFYSSFAHQYKDWKGVKLLGLREHIFEDSDSVREQPEEAARRLHDAIKEATELISRVITNKYRPYQYKYQ